MQVAFDVSETSPSATPVLSYRHEGRLYHALLKGEKRYKLGRSSESAISIPKTMNFVSRHHATIVEHDNRWFLEDNESRNGSFVNNKRIDHRAIINDGDIIHLGWLEIAFQMRTPEEESLIESRQPVEQDERLPTSPMISEDDDLIDDSGPDVEAPLYYEESLGVGEVELEQDVEDLIERSTEGAGDLSDLDLPAVEDPTGENPAAESPARKSRTMVSKPGDASVPGPPESNFQVNASIQLSDFQKTKGFDSKIRKGVDLPDLERPTEGATEANASSQHFGPNQSWILDVFKNLTSNMVQNQDKKEFYQSMLEEVLNLIPAERGVVCLEREAGQFEPAVFLSKNDQSTRRLEISRSILNTATARQNALLVEDTKSSEFSDEASIQDLDIFSAMCMPIMSDGNVHGVLYVDTSNPIIPFNETHLEIFSAIGVFAAIALDTIDQRLALEAEVESVHESVASTGSDREAESSEEAASAPAAEVVEPYTSGATVLFAKYCPSSKLYQQDLPADEIFGRVNDNLLEFSQTIESLGGQPAILAGTQVFGYFEKQDDFDASSAAMDAARTLMKNQEERFASAPDDEQFELQIGLATGNVTRASTSDAQPEQVVCIGEAVEAAREFCTNVASCGEILVDLDTYLAVRDKLECEPLSPVKLSISARAVPIFKVLNND